ncbi:unnamed protein product, partial [Amoebophrya sp. A25]|eukprot:GSA25T00020490001.1
MESGEEHTVDASDIRDLTVEEEKKFKFHDRAGGRVDNDRAVGKNGRKDHKAESNNGNNVKKAEEIESALPRGPPTVIEPLTTLGKPMP